MYERIIEDAPLFIHRGFLVDTAKHYISVDEIVMFIDAMAVVKMNVFHWHMTDDSSFPYVSSTYPRLSREGAYHPRKLVYENEDVVRVIEYARLRGIRVMVEFDTPSHTKSWEKSYRGMRTKCSSGSQLGPFNPAREANFKILKAFFREVTSVFPEAYIHLGGNDVSFSCWESNAGISDFMKLKKFGDDYGKLESYYFDRLIEAIQSVQPEGHAITPVVSNEVFHNGYRPNKTIVMHVWQGINWPNIVKSITSTGYRVIVSACLQISPSNQATRWYDYHNCDIAAFEGTEEEQKLVIGGEAIVSGENVDDTNLFTRAWPEGAVIADRLWSHDQSTIVEMKQILDELRCYMRELGFKVKPLDEPKSCLQP
ncbi:unnamed protein product [Trichobilharzia szidati]|nr:unnamed protein product [Trichobilharzia szidati]